MRERGGGRTYNWGQILIKGRVRLCPLKTLHCTTQLLVSLGISFALNFERSAKRRKDAELPFNVCTTSDTHTKVPVCARACVRGEGNCTKTEKWFPSRGVCSRPNIHAPFDMPPTCTTQVEIEEGPRRHGGPPPLHLLRSFTSKYTLFFILFPASFKILTKWPENQCLR